MRAIHIVFGDQEFIYFGDTIKKVTEELLGDGFNKEDIAGTYRVKSIGATKYSLPDSFVVECSQ